MINSLNQVKSVTFVCVQVIWQMYPKQQVGKFYISSSMKWTHDDEINNKNHNALHG